MVLDQNCSPKLPRTKLVNETRGRKQSGEQAESWGWRSTATGPAELGVQALTGWVRRKLATQGGELEGHRVEARPRETWARVLGRLPSL